MLTRSIVHTVCRNPRGYNSRDALFFGLRAPGNDRELGVRLPEVNSGEFSLL